VPKNYIVLRSSPDWLSFDVAQSRTFLRARGEPENAIAEFIAVWDGAMAIDYRRFRHAAKAIALETFRAAVSGIFVTGDEFRGMTPAPDDLIVFSDDDDWLAPDVFPRLRDAGPAGDGAIWGSLRLGPALREPAGLTRRAIDGHIYTNNAAISGAALARLGFDAVAEHEELMRRVLAGAFAPRRLPQYLSLANKHPCCTRVVLTLMARDRFRADPRAEIGDYAAMIDAACAASRAEWFAGSLAKLQSLVHAALGRA
jgi:hypothetical protein